jgi:hypothetical protein
MHGKETGMKKTYYILLGFLVLAFSALLPSGSIKALSISPAGEYDLKVISDGSGGEYVAWSLGWYPSSLEIQHISTSGLPLWKEPAVLPGNTKKFQIAEDGLGGIFVTHEIYPNSGTKGVYELRVQRIDADGNPKWASSGVLLLQKDIPNFDPLLRELNILPDYAGSVYVIWKPYSENRIVAQKVGINGEKLWGEGGIEITPSYPKLGPVYTGDNDGGFITAWVEWQQLKNIVHLARYNREGVILWQNASIKIDEDYNSINVISDGENGAYIALANIQNASLMRIDGSGEMVWGRQQIASVKGYISNVCLLRDAHSGRLHLAWAEAEDNYINTYYHKLYVNVQYFTALGVPSWGEGPKQVAAFTGTEPLLQITSDGDGGTILMWKSVKGDDYSVTAQRINQAGETLWGENGKKVKKLYRMVRDFIIYPDTNGVMLFTQEGGYAQPNLYVHFIDGFGDIKEAETAFYPLGEPKVTKDLEYLMFDAEPRWSIITPIVVILVGGALFMTFFGPGKLVRRIRNRKKYIIKGNIQ